MKFAQFIAAGVILHLAAATPLSYPKPLNPKQAALLASWTPGSKQHMWQLSGQYQGDILLAAGQRNGVTDTRLRWPNRVVPYVFSNDFSNTSSDTDYVYITGQDTGCWSWVGRLGGSQELNLQRNGCIWYGTIVHEFLHAAGFYHQQSATERDDWVDILWNNIESGQEHNFDKYGSDMITSFGEQYDYDSIMHYDKYAFSWNGQPTIVPKDPNANIGQSDGLSPIDIAKLNKMYGCA